MNPIRQALTRRYSRTPRGQAVVVLMLFLAVFIVGPLSFFAYNVSLYNLAKQQLKACVDGAALAAGCSQAANNNLTSYSTVQSQAEQTAVWLFRQNSILGDALGTTNPNGPATIVHGSGSILQPLARQGLLSYEWINPTTGAIVADGDPTGKTIRVFGAYGFVPAFGNFSYMGGLVFPIIDSANGALPQLDVVLCFDLSSSMDDFTYCFCVQRVWDKVNSRTTYLIVNKGGGNGMSPLGNGSQAVYYAVGSTNTTGTSVGCTWPTTFQGEAVSGLPDRGSGGTVAQPCGIGSGQRGSSKANHAAPPYYTAPGTGTTGGNYQMGATNFTDLIVDVSYAWAVNQSNTPDGTCSDGYTWPTLNSAASVGLAVEASRGNLESTAEASAAGLTIVSSAVQFYHNGSDGGGLTTPFAGLVTPQVGWYNRYWQIANRWTYLNPVGAGALASQDFFQIINNDADSHFGLVCYGTGEGSGNTSDVSNLETSGSTAPYAFTVEAYPWGNTGNTPCPYIALDPTVGNTNYTTCLDLMTNTYNGSGVANASTQSAAINNQLKPNGSTDIAGALHASLQQLMKPSEATGGPYPVTTGYQLARPNSHRAIVLFTDGLPTVSSIGGDATTAALNMGSEAGSAGIPVYCVGLCMTPGLQSAQNNVLNASTGIAGLAGSGSQYFQATNTNTLITAFEAVARALVQLVRNN